MKFQKEFNGTIEERFAIRRKLTLPFIKKYGNPVLVHAVSKTKTFKKILETGKLKVPEKCSPMEKLLGIGGIFYSLGFVYHINYGWKYNIIFDLKYLKELKYYKNNINYNACISIINYWYDNDREYLEKLANTNAKCKEVLDRYFNDAKAGRNRNLDFWKIEKETFNAIKKYKNQKVITNIIKKTESNFNKKFPNSLADAKKAYFELRTPEAIGFNENNLLSNKYFIGFYIAGKIPKDIEKILKNKYKGKILFDGKSIGELR